MSEERQKIEDVLKTEGIFVSTTSGKSMYPMLRNRRDTIIVQPVKEPLKKYDVVLYRRGKSYVLHRIIKLLPDGYVICGDNCLEREYGITKEQILGVLTGCYRGEKKLDLNRTSYRAYVRFWCLIYPVRRFLKIIRIYFGKIKSKRK